LSIYKAGGVDSDYGKGAGMESIREANLRNQTAIYTECIKPSLFFARRFLTPRTLGVVCAQAMRQLFAFAILKRRRLWVFIFGVQLNCEIALAFLRRRQGLFDPLALISLFQQTPFFAHRLGAAAA